jgi:hypothetical protein
VDEQKFFKCAIKKIRQLRNELKVLKRQKLERGLTSSNVWECSNKAYNMLAQNGTHSLHVLGKRFDVGATKILNFLFPELFIIIDSRVADVLKKYYSFPYRSGTQKKYSFDKYFSAMNTYHNEVISWIQNGKTLDELLSYDRQPTTLTRVLDKCAYVTE